MTVHEPLYCCLIKYAVFNYSFLPSSDTERLDLKIDLFLTNIIITERIFFSLL